MSENEICTDSKENSNSSLPVLGIISNNISPGVSPKSSPEVTKQKFKFTLPILQDVHEKEEANTPEIDESVEKLAKDYEIDEDKKLELLLLKKEQKELVLELMDKEKRSPSINSMTDSPFQSPGSAKSSPSLHVKVGSLDKSIDYNKTPDTKTQNHKFSFLSPRLISPRSTSPRNPLAFMKKKKDEPKRPTLKISDPISVTENHNLDDILEDFEFSKTLLEISQSVESEKRQNIYDMTKEQKILLVKLYQQRNIETPKKDIKRQTKFTDRSFSGYNINFSSVFSVKEIQDAFILHLESESNQEPYEFLVEINNMSQKNNQETLDKFYYIIETYLLDTSPKQININSILKTNIMNIYKEMKNKENINIDKKYFDIIEKIKSNVFTDLKQDVWPRFIQSENGYISISNHIDNPKVMSRKPSSAVFFKLQNLYLGQQNINDEIEIEENSHILSNPIRFDLKYFSNM